MISHEPGCHHDGKLALAPYFNARIVRCQECGVELKRISELAERCYQWGLTDGKRVKQAEIKKALAIHD